MRLKLITAATEQALAVDEVRKHLNLDSADDDALLERWIRAAQQKFEQFTDRILFQSTWDLYLDEFPARREIELPAPLSSVTSVTYYDTANALQTLSASYYQVDTVSEPVARLTLGYGYSWPSTYDNPNAVIVRFVAGYASAAAVPQDIKDGMSLHIAHMYENREPVNVGNITTPINHWENCWANYRRIPV